jgi:hypothetical protein
MLVVTGTALTDLRPRRAERDNASIGWNSRSLDGKWSAWILNNPKMPSYGMSEDHGFPIYYELLSLDEALSGEASANEDYREDFGDGFDDYLSAQLEVVRSTYDAGLVWGTAFSVRAPTGEFGAAIPLQAVTRIDHEQFEMARVDRWGAESRGR